MFTRIVKMEFRPDEIATFLSNFEVVKTEIRNFPGCMELTLYRDKSNRNTFFTYSKWVTEEDLENYRNSDLFKKVWKQTKGLFQNKAAAWSVDAVHELL